MALPLRKVVDVLPVPAVFLRGPAGVSSARLAESEIFCEACAIESLIVFDGEAALSEDADESGPGVLAGPGAIVERAGEAVDAGRRRGGGEGEMELGADQLEEVADVGCGGELVVVERDSEDLFALKDEFNDVEAHVSWYSLAVAAGWRKAIGSWRPSTSLSAALRPAAAWKRFARHVYGLTEVGPFLRLWGGPWRSAGVGG